jgi:hypothetical protein
MNDPVKPDEQSPLIDFEIIKRYAIRKTLKKIRIVLPQNQKSGILLLSDTEQDKKRESFPQLPPPG